MQLPVVILCCVPDYHSVLLWTQKNSLALTNVVDVKGLLSCVHFVSLSMLTCGEQCSLNCGRVILFYFRSSRDRENHMQLKVAVQTT